MSVDEIKLAMLTYESMAYASAILASVLIFGWVGGQVYVWRQNKADRRVPKDNARIDSIIADYKLPAKPESSSYDTNIWRKVRTRHNQTLHQASINQKKIYYDYIGRSGALLIFTFLLLALSLTLLKENQNFQITIAYIDILSIAFVIWYWMRARVANRFWVRTRAHAELMRQWCNLAHVFGQEESDLNASFDEACSVVQKFLYPQSHFQKFKMWIGWEPHFNKEIEGKINIYWSNFRHSLEILEYRSGVPRYIKFNTYLYHRPVKQLEWLQMRRAQILSSGRKRGMITMALFFITLILAVANLFIPRSNELAAAPVFLNESVGDWLTLILLLTTAVSAAMAYWSLGRNERSLRHRYKTQQRQMENWLNGAALQLSKSDNITFNSILEFEDIMVEELIDWIHITSQDLVELG